jgi:cysteine-rich repeat protein
MRGKVEVTLVAALLLIGSWMTLGAAPVGAGFVCPGDCDLSGSVEVSDVVLSVRASLELIEVSVCESADANGDGEVTISELISVVVASLAGCLGSVRGECGDSERGFGEQCDDGNFEHGDFCSNCRLEGPGAVDQIWLGKRPGCGGGSGATNINSVGPLGQQFVPRFPWLEALSVALRAVGVEDAGSQTEVTLEIREETLDGAIVASVSEIVIAFPSLPRMFWHRFDFSDGVELRTGRTYAIVLTNPAGALMWMDGSGFESCAQSGYPDGLKLSPSGSGSRDDYLFATFGSL